MIYRHAILALWCVVLWHGEARSDDANELKQLEGVWSFVGPAGENAEKKKSAAVQVVFQGNTITFRSDDNKRNQQGSYTIDPSQTPMAMDITLDQGGAKAVTLVIFELKGDTLKLCHYLGVKAGKERPKQFMADKQTVLGILKREK